jgi:hypothetical protein
MESGLTTPFIMMTGRPTEFDVSGTNIQLVMVKTFQTDTLLTNIQSIRSDRSVDHWSVKSYADTPLSDHLIDLQNNPSGILHLTE